ncbi:hypothetical protein [Methyloceanibacter sp.]|uniref:hypothetical protein n=1 Tax=Methyloceanibacter sp. TaxID=1965321 RepID=UPI002D3F6BF6|nr:hypothetical protein [Methyloceanibacter sp.]HZP10396.1 hypothetical protein [Methyloceanibacter sp.]
MPRIAAERMQSHVAVGVVEVRRRVPSPVRFFALDGSIRVVIEADSEDDARCLCRDMGYEFIGLCG